MELVLTAVALLLLMLSPILIPCIALYTIAFVWILRKTVWVWGSLLGLLLLVHLVGM